MFLPLTKFFSFEILGDTVSRGEEPFRHCCWITGHYKQHLDPFGQIFPLAQAQSLKWTWWGVLPCRGFASFFRIPSFLRNLVWPLPLSVADFSVTCFCVSTTSRLSTLVLAGILAISPWTLVTRFLWMMLLFTPRFPRPGGKVADYVS